MRRLPVIIAFVLIVLSSCSKTAVSVVPQGESSVKVHVCLPDAAKAVFDSDGRGSLVNHWVVEVRDSENPERVLIHQEKDSPEGVLEQTFELSLVLYQNYDIAFWADSKGCYDTGSLSDVAVISPSGNKEMFDAFCCVLDTYTYTGDEDMSATLRRPLSQINFITTDLQILRGQSSKDALAPYEPENFVLTMPAATRYNVFAGAAVESSISTLTLTAPKMYGDFSSDAENTTLFMGYVFGDSSSVKDINIKFESNSHKYSFDLTNIPFKKNYRTNILGNFFAGKVTCSIWVDSDWFGVEE